MANVNKEVEITVLKLTKKLVHIQSCTIASAFITSCKLPNHEYDNINLR